MKKAHIISHSHWDREWYMPYEKHHMLLIEFMDRLIDTLETDKEFKSFHLDGQTIMLEDYLQVRPERKEQLKKYIKEGRIVIGPWYILQDEWLTCSESNVRNMQVGARDGKEYGGWCPIGYFPDSFGNMGQAPQILLEAGIDTAVFGRGVKPTGFNNQVEDSNEFSSQFSEMYWESPDGSKVLGILFANWYSNGIEVPTDEKEARIYWDQKLQDAMKYASTDELLFMNGCDHQPVQADISEAIKTSEALYEDITFIHSNFIDYTNAVKANKKESWNVIKGELRSQNTEGWYTLANTASSRIYLKQLNTKCEMLLSKTAEPLAAMAHKLGMEYPHHLFLYAWKTLMQCHPHDSICGCSVDEVHQEMVSRFHKAIQTAQHIIDESIDYLTKLIDTASFKALDKEARPFVVVNPTGYVKNGTCETIVPLEKFYFRDNDVATCVKNAKAMPIGEYHVIDQHGNIIPGKVEILPSSFQYDLPKDKFRVPYMVRNAKVTVELSELNAFSYVSFALVPSETKHREESTLITGPLQMENQFMCVTFNENGSLNILEKESNRTWKNLGLFEDCGDVGNEYIYGTPYNETPITSQSLKAVINVIEDSPYQAVIETKITMMIPKEANHVLEEEINDLIEFKNRKAARTEELIPMEIKSYYTLERLSKTLKVRTEYNNQALDHRLRVLFPTNIQSPYHYADSIFEVAKRNNQPSEDWKNPCNAQHQQAFVNLHDDVNGLTIANIGLNEYEVLRDDSNTIALTIHRGVRELGDWGVFPTPEAQCLGQQRVEYAIIPHGKDTTINESYESAYNFQTQVCSKEMVREDHTESKASMEPTRTIFKISSDNLLWTSLKICETTGDVVARWYNASDKSGVINVDETSNIYQTNLLEETNIKNLNNKTTVAPYKIFTLAFSKN